MNVLEILDEIDMKPCPFCGNDEPRLYRRDGIGGGKTFFAEASCPVCRVSMYSDGASKTYQEARTNVIKRWNQRWEGEE